MKISQITAEIKMWEIWAWILSAYAMGFFFGTKFPAIMEALKP